MTMIKFFKSLFGIKSKTSVEEFAASADKITCTYCGGTDFYEGPSGGAATNIYCANAKCRHWFNVDTFGLSYFEDLHRQDPER